MKEFIHYFNDEAIIKYLCKQRAKIAKNRNKKQVIHSLSNSAKFNHHVNEHQKYFNKEMTYQSEFIIFQRNFIIDLNSILPSRKKWVTLGQDQRINRRNNQSISSSDRNVYSIIKTIKHFRKYSPEVPWLKKLDEFIQEIKSAVISEDYVIQAPIIYPKLKGKANMTKNECRPLSLFSLKDRTILSLTNKYLTKLFDKYFEDSSFAFRSKTNLETKTTLTHHDCIRAIKDYRKSNDGSPLWVVECDMEKFYDSVNHQLVKELFCDLVMKAKIDEPDLDLEKPTHIFEQFLNCYSFNKNVLPLNNDSKYWDNYQIVQGEFGWVDSQLEKMQYYCNIDAERIGVPQGGALSGLIANIVLDKTDKEMVNTNVFYSRFCDDMIIIHSNENECNKAKEIYLKSLKSLKLVPHEFSSKLVNKRKHPKKGLPSDTISPFWKEKSKGPYLWGPLGENSFPWIGFVGYELHHEGHIRVRKKSLNKELTKQNEVVEEIIKASNDNRRKSASSIAKTAILRLIGMSVGKITMRNFETASNDLCWKNGFKELDMNLHSSRQMRMLDRNRNRLYYMLNRELRKFEESDKGEDKKNSKILPKMKQIIYYNKPFSYFYQVLERKAKITTKVEKTND